MFLGLDIGTSCVKAVVVDETGTVVGQASVDLTSSRPHPLWSEQDPADWWSATNSAVSQLPAGIRRGVRGIGLAGQMHGATLLDRSHRALRPAILWNDGRAAAQCVQLEADCPDLGAISGNRAMPGFTAPKLMWVREHEPAIFDQVAMVLLPKDYVRLRMTGDCASDMSDAAGTLWLDVARRDWSDRLLAATGLTRSQMPALHEGSDITGRLRAELAEAWGMDQVPVVAGGGDNAAGAVGVGVVRPGDAFLSLGTSGVLFLANATYQPNPAGGVHTFCHALPNRWHQMAVHLSAASCIDWAARLTGLNDAAALLRVVENRGALAQSVVFLPYLSGERTPHNDPNATGVLFGLNHDSDAAVVGQAVLEGVAMAFRDGLDALVDAGSQLDTITVIGGGSRSAYWGRLLAASLDRPLTYRRGGEVGPAYGAARLAQLGVDHGTVEIVCAPPPVDRVIEPEPALVEHFARHQPHFRSLYSSLQARFKECQA
ncbi:xylulokinase [Novosphingobium sp.]|uniref:xylulokinase n=1 Tax=Novosphingobium sp. TaxID=1874826 RepID=UPI003B5205DB